MTDARSVEKLAWGRIGSTQPVDPAAAQGVIDEMYALGGRPPPQIVWVDSPSEAFPVVMALNHSVGSGDVRIIRDEIQSKFAKDWSLGDTNDRSRNLASGHDAPLGAITRATQAEAISKVRAILAMEIAPARAAILRATANKMALEKLIRSDSRTRTSRPSELFGLSTSFSAFKSPTSSPGLWERYLERTYRTFPYGGIAVSVRRPVEVHYDEAENAGGFRFRLHGETGKALRFADDTGVYSWHGMIIPASKSWIIDQPKRITPARIEGEPNVEIRRVMLEKFGFEPYIESRGAKVINSDEKFGQPRRLLEMVVAGDRMLVLDVWNGSLEPDGTRRRFFLGANPAARSVEEAVAMSYGIDPRVYDEGVRT